MNEKHKFFNELFPTLFIASYTRLQSQFVGYFKSERKLRWDFKWDIAEAEARYDTIVNKPVGESGGYGLKRYYIAPARFNKQVIKNGLDELFKVKNNVEMLREKLIKTRKEQILNKHGVVK